MASKYYRFQNTLYDGDAIDVIRLAKTFLYRPMLHLQGKFPDFNKVWDEWEFLSPVDAFPAQNEYGESNRLVIDQTCGLNRSL